MSLAVHVHSYRLRKVFNAEIAHNGLHSRGGAHEIQIRLSILLATFRGYIRSSLRGKLGDPCLE